MALIKICKLLKNLEEKSSSFASTFGEKFCYLVKGSKALLNVTHSCFGNIRDSNVVNDDDLPGDKSSLIAILNECVDLNLRFRYESNTKLKRFEVDLANIIQIFRFLYARYNIRSTVTCHLYFHALEYFVKFEPDKQYALGLSNTAAFESVHSKVSAIFGQNMPLQTDSESYATAILQRLNQFNIKYIDKELLRDDSLSEN